MARALPLALRLAMAAALCLLAGGCFDAPTPACNFLCGADQACPDGYRCATDGWCKRTDIADDYVCDDTVTPDAAPPDAAPPDAAPPDAEPPDAELPDAMPPDAA
ncbi:hypothetical protein [Haliangium sp.]|uniref:hypothetical protein n=1 Tax=Haliangium sp. TaxID=2663208 RepID=UPI003D13163D